MSVSLERDSRLKIKATDAAAALAKANCSKDSVPIEWEKSAVWMKPLVPQEPNTSVHHSSYQHPTVENRSDLVYKRNDRGKYLAAHGPYPQNDGADRLLPATGQLHLLGCDPPFTYLPRKRRVAARIEDNRILNFNYEGKRPNSQEHFIRDVCSVNGLPYARRRYLRGACSTLE